MTILESLKKKVEQEKNLRTRWNLVSEISILELQKELKDQIPKLQTLTDVAEHQENVMQWHHILKQSKNLPRMKKDYYWKLKNFEEFIESESQKIRLAKDVESYKVKCKSSLGRTIEKWWEFEKETGRR